MILHKLGHCDLLNRFYAQFCKNFKTYFSPKQHDRFSLHLVCGVLDATLYKLGHYGLYYQIGGHESWNNIFAIFSGIAFLIQLKFSM